MHTKKDKALIGVKKAKTSLEKIITAIEHETNCEDIITQNLAVIGLLKKANINLLEAFMDRNKDTEINREKILHVLELIQK